MGLGAPVPLRGPPSAPSCLGAPALCVLRPHGWRRAFFHSPTAANLRTSFGTKGRFSAPLLRRGLSYGLYRLRRQLVPYSTRRFAAAALWFGRSCYALTPSRRAGLVLVSLFPDDHGGSAPKPPATQASTFNLSTSTEETKANTHRGMFKQTYPNYFILRVQRCRAKPIKNDTMTKNQIIYNSNVR